MTGLVGVSGVGGFSPVDLGKMLSGQIANASLSMGSYTHGVGLIVLTVFDVFVIGLIWHEYRLVRRHLTSR